MNEHDSMSVGEVTCLSSSAGRWAPRLAVLGAGSLLLGFVASLVLQDAFSRFLVAYLVAFCFCLSVSLGALFFVVFGFHCRANISEY